MKKCMHCYKRSWNEYSYFLCQTSKILNRRLPLQIDFFSIIYIHGHFFICSDIWDIWHHVRAIMWIKHTWLFLGIVLGHAITWKHGPNLLEKIAKSILISINYLENLTTISILYNYVYSHDYLFIKTVQTEVFTDRFKVIYVSNICFPRWSRFGSVTRCKINGEW